MQFFRTGGRGGVICIVTNILRNTGRLHMVHAATQDTDIKQGVL
jgi:hypothetical protein